MFLEKKCIGCGTCEETCPNEAMSISGKEMKLSEIYQVIIRDFDYYVQSGGGLTLSGGEALLYIEAVMPLLKKCREDGIHISVETCGNIPEKNIEAALAIVDLFLFDIKSLNEEKLAKHTGGNIQLCGRTWGEQDQPASLSHAGHHQIQSVRRAVSF